MSLDEAGLSLRTAPRILRRHGRKMALLAVFLLGGTVLATALWPRTYRSEAKLLVRLGRENTTVDATATLGQTSVVTIPMGRESEINSILEELTSRDLIERVVDSVGAQAVLGSADPNPASSESTEPADSTTPTERYQAVRSLTKSLRVEVVKKSNILVVSCDAGRPDTAQAIVARLVDLSLDRHMTLNRTPGAYRLLSRQAAGLDDRVQQTEEELRTLKSQAALVSPEAQRQILANRVGRLDDELLQARVNLQAAQAEAQVVEKQMARLPQTQITASTRGMPNQAADQMRAQLYTLQLKELDLLARHPENHPEVKLIRRQTAAAKEILAREEASREQTTHGPYRLREELMQALNRQQALTAALQTRKESLERQLQQARDGLKSFLSDELRTARLQRRLELLVSQQRKYAEILEQGRIDQALQSERISNISLVQSATNDVKPIRPRWSINLGLGLLLALSGSAGLGVFLEYRTSTVVQDAAEKRLSTPTPESPLHSGRTGSLGVLQDVSGG